MIAKSKVDNNELYVVFDTSAIFNRRVSRLVSQTAAAVIQNHSSHLGLSVSWYVPRMVLDERRYQMQLAAADLASSAEKLDDLFEANLKFSESQISKAIDNRISNAIENLGLEIIELDIGTVDWTRLVSDSVNRRPPFEEGDNEKGFRDAIILESFMQLVEGHENNGSVRRFVLACEDELLAHSANTRTSSRTDVIQAAPIRDIEGTINALVSKVDEKRVADLQQVAEKLFFLSGDRNSLFYKWDIPSDIENQFSQELIQLPMGARRRRNWDYVVLPPQFAAKSNSRITWVSQVTLDHTAYTHMYPSQAGSSGGISSGLTPSLGSSSLSTAGYDTSPFDIYPASSGGTYSSFPSTVGLSSSPFSIGTSGSGLQPPLIPREVILSVGRTIFEVEWSAEASDDNKLSQEKISGIKIVEFNWF